VATHVDFVGVLFIVWGALTALVGLSTLALGVGAASLATSANLAGGHVAAGVTAAAFIALAVIAIVWGGGHVWLGVLVRRRRHHVRIVAILVSSIDLLLLPYGTALGGYALWVLLSERGKALFAAAA
jgi:hypothetical protein